MKSYLKQIEKDSAAKKKSLILSKEELFSFLESDTDDDRKFLVRKAVLVMGYFGGLRCAELVALNFEDWWPLIKIAFVFLFSQVKLIHMVKRNFISLFSTWMDGLTIVQSTPMRL